MDGRALLRYVRMVTRKIKGGILGWCGWMPWMDGWWECDDTDGYGFGYGYTLRIQSVYNVVTCYSYSLQFWYNTLAGREGGAQ